MATTKTLDFLDPSNLLIYLIPGSVFLIGVLGPFPQIYQNANFNTIALLTPVFIFSSFAIGQIIAREPMPTLFKRAVQDIKGEDISSSDGILKRLIEEIPDIQPITWFKGLHELLRRIIGRIQTERNVDSVTHTTWEICKSKFGVGDGFDNYYEIYQMITIYLDEDLGNRAERFRMMYLFYHNMMAAFSLLALIYAFIVILSLYELYFSNGITLGVENIVIAFLLLPIWLYVSLLFYLGSRDYQYAFINELLVEFYMKCKSESNLPEIGS